MRLLESGREKLANDTYSLILSSAAERFLCYSFLDIDISDFQPKIEDKTASMLNFIKKHK